MPEPSDYTRHCGRLVRQRRTDLKLSQVEVAEQSGLSQATVSQVESGVIRATDGTRVALARALRTRVNALFPYPDDVPEEAAS